MHARSGDWRRLQQVVKSLITCSQVTCYCKLAVLLCHAATHQEGSGHGWHVRYVQPWNQVSQVDLDVTQQVRQPQRRLQASQQVWQCHIWQLRQVWQGEPEAPKELWEGDVD